MNPKVFYGIVLLLIVSCSHRTTKENLIMKNSENPRFKVEKSEEEWKAELSPENYQVLRQAGTERPFTGKYNLHFEKGIYTCGACNEPLFSSDSKFEAHCGWPSFDKEMEAGKIIEKTDTSFGMTRTEILCGSCGSHLGHVFDDGPTETGLRYCVNSLSLNFEEETEE
jgi:peptide-methionine (R)-S-oxide reductase